MRGTMEDKDDQDNSEAELGPDEEPEKDDAQEDAKEDEEPAHHAKKADAKHGAVGRAWHWLKAKPWRLAAAVSGLVVVVAAGVIGLTDLRYAVLGAVWKSTVDLRVV